MDGSSHTAWSAPLVLIGMRLLYVEAGLSRAKSSGKSIVFRGALGLRILFGVAIFYTTWTVIAAVGHEESWVLILGEVIAALFCLAWPAVITIDDIGVSKKRWWRPMKTIRWDEISGVERDGAGTYSVLSTGLKAIDFDKYHVDSSRFVSEVLMRANLKSVIDSSAPPSILVDYHKHPEDRKPATPGHHHSSREERKKLHDKK